jgi:hypothetical protein
MPIVSQNVKIHNEAKVRTAMKRERLARARRIVLKLEIDPCEVASLARRIDFYCPEAIVMKVKLVELFS